MSTHVEKGNVRETYSPIHKAFCTAHGVLKGCVTTWVILIGKGTHQFETEIRGDLLRLKKSEEVIGTSPSLLNPLPMRNISQSVRDQN